MHDAGEFSFPAIAESLSAARACVRGVLQGHQRADKELDVNIAVGEILQNIVRYGFDGGNQAGSFKMHFLIADHGLEITITDDAPPSDSATWSNAHRKAEEGGHGLTLVHELTDSVAFEMLEGGNRATLRFAL